MHRTGNFLSRIVFEVKESLSDGERLCKSLAAHPMYGGFANMRLKSQCLSLLLAASALVAPLALTGCAEHATVRVYDPYYADYHVWDNGEVVYYNRWVAETHRPYVKYERLRPEDQRAYWTWRHEHR